MKTTLLTIGTIIAFTAGTTLFTACGSGNQQEEESTEQHDIDGSSDSDSSDSESTEAVAETTHACPMHPEVTGLEGDSCSKCGMDLTLAEASDEEHDHQH